MSANVGGEAFGLHNHSAQDVRRYDFVQDVVRLERVVSDDSHMAGFAILLTNEGLMWSPSSHCDAFDRDFHLHEGRLLQGKLEWDKRVSSGTIKNRETPLSLNGTYMLKWREYYQVQTIQKHGLFQFLVVAVHSRNA
jgi:hypothetical protein